MLPFDQIAVERHDDNFQKTYVKKYVRSYFRKTGVFIFGFILLAISFTLVYLMVLNHKEIQGLKDSQEKEQCPASERAKDKERRKDQQT